MTEQLAESSGERMIKNWSVLCFVFWFIIQVSQLFWRRVDYLQRLLASCFLASLVFAVAACSETVGIDLPPSKLVTRSSQIFDSLQEAHAYGKLVLWSTARRGFFFSLFFIAGGGWHALAIFKAGMAVTLLNHAVPPTVQLAAHLMKVAFWGRRRASFTCLLPETVRSCTISHIAALVLPLCMVLFLTLALGQIITDIVDAVRSYGSSLVLFCSLFCIILRCLNVMVRDLHVESIPHMNSSLNLVTAMSGYKKKFDAVVQTETNLCAACYSGYDSLTAIGKKIEEELQSKDLTCESMKSMSDDEVMALLNSKRVAQYNLEKLLKDTQRSVVVRRRWLAQFLPNSAVLDSLPHLQFDYASLVSACCENVIGYVQVPVGFAGPLLVDNERVFVPMSTTEGCLIASVNRGCRALTTSGGVKTVVLADSMTRGPVLVFDNIEKAANFKFWTEHPSNFPLMKDIFDATSRFARLSTVTAHLVGRLVYLRFSATTGDAMGMNMVSKGVEVLLSTLRSKYFPEMRILSLSGNLCVDKKASAMNWIEGRGKSVTAEAIVSSTVVRNVLKTDVDSLVELNTAKNFIGSMRAGCLGGFNAHSANVVGAIFIATGQDVAQVVSSSSCLTVIEKTAEDDLRISCTMPCLEVGTVGGGTFLPAQRSALQMLSCAGGHPTQPGQNAKKLARIICATVVAGELSLLSALSAGHLVRSHLRYNRSTASFSLAVDGCSRSQRSLGSTSQSSTILNQLSSVTHRALKPPCDLKPDSCSKVLT